MIQTANLKIGFIGWNPFQLLHVKKVIEALPGSCFILEQRADYLDEFDNSLLTNPSVPVLVWPRATIDALDGIFDIIVCQVPFSKIQNFTKSRIAMMQYGYAKEVHNYGAWRSFSSLSLAYGDYAARKLSHFGPALPVGNSRYDDWASTEFHESAKRDHFSGLDPSRKTILYAPTWGDLSSIEEFSGAVFDLSEKYNVVLKMHHNTALLESGRVGKISNPKIKYFGANADLMELLSIADLAISDYSGAIFDALFAQKPVVLLDMDLTKVMGKKIDVHSLEYEQRDAIGMRVSRPDMLLDTVDAAFEQEAQLIAKAAPLRKDLFNDSPGATQRIVQALQDLGTGLHEPSQIQSYVRSEIIELYKAKAKITSLTKKIETLEAAAKYAANANAKVSAKTSVMKPAAAAKKIRKI
ncbi:MAG: CDP-glycerol glycerophosphotransferase family protein [Acidovorax sp.]|uniref:CDP-glycerol glycerophosphotransferase family protein n=1 Tax=Acidovorax sp. TaxID=1872122 RepID=UPI0039E6FC8D